MPIANNSEVKIPVPQTAQTLPPLIILSPTPTEPIMEKVFPKKVIPEPKSNKTKVANYKPIVDDRSENDVEKTEKKIFDDMLPVPTTTQNVIVTSEKQNFPSSTTVHETEKSLGE